MAPETTKIKRKSLDRKVKSTDDASAPPAKKVKTSSDAPGPEKVKAAAEAKKNRKRASDFIDVVEPAAEQKSEPAPVKTKKRKTAAPTEDAEKETIVAPKAKKAKADKKSKKSEAPAEIGEETPKPTLKTKQSKADKSNKENAEPVEPAEIHTTVTSKPKKATADKATKKSLGPVEAVEEPAVAPAKSKKAKAEKSSKKIAEPTEAVEEIPAAITKSKKAKAEKSTKKAVEVTEDVEVAPESILKKSKASKKGAEPVEEAEALPTSISKPKKSKADKATTKKSESKAIVPAESLEDAFDGFSSGDEDNIEDQTAALLAGFESSSEDSEAEEEGMPLNQVPSVKLTKESKKALAAAKANKDENDTPGTIYVGRVPHGFYEHQMKAYFSQFGDVLRLRVSRNKKTGASRHFAFIEFASSEVADIVARTMNNYLMFGHILKVRLIPAEQVHKDLWKGAGKRFKVIPRAKLEARDLAMPKGRDYWRKKVSTEEEKRKEKNEKLKELGYEFDMPQVRKVEDVPMKGTDGAVKAVEGAETEKVVDEPIKAIESAEAVKVDPVEKEVLSVIAKKRSKGKGSEIVGDSVKVKVKKAKKAKA